MSVDRRLKRAIQECQCKLEVEWRMRDLLPRRRERLEQRLADLTDAYEGHPILLAKLLLSLTAWRLEWIRQEQERNWKEVARLEKRMMLLLDLESLQLHKELFGEELEEI